MTNVATRYGYNFRTIEPREIARVLDEIYPGSEFTIGGNKRDIFRGRMSGVDLGGCARYEAEYGSPCTLTVPRERDSLVVLSCREGSARVRCDGEELRLEAGMSTVIDASGHLERASDGAIALTSVHIDRAVLERRCIRLLGRSLPARPRFTLAPLHDDAQASWKTLQANFDSLFAVADPAELALEGFIDTATAFLVLNHPNNLGSREHVRRGASEQLVREAMRFIDDHAVAGMTAADVAAHFDVSLIGLHSAFCDFEGVGVRAYIRRARLARSASSSDAVEREAAGGAAARGQRILGRRLDEPDADPSAAAGGEGADGEDERKVVEEGRALPLAMEFDAGDRALIRAYVETHLAQKITIDHLCILLNLERHVLSARFKATFGRTPAQHVLAERLGWAKWMLSHGRMPLAEIARATGFGSQSHFTVTFVQQEGTTPLAYRRSTSTYPTGKRSGAGSRREARAES